MPKVSVYYVLLKKCMLTVQGNRVAICTGLYSLQLAEEE